MPTRAITQAELHSPLVPYDDALALVREAVAVMEPEVIPLPLALGAVLADDVVAGIDVPSFDNSAMDGYLVDSATTAGASPEFPVALDTARRIATGGPIAAGHDAVVPWEATRSDGDRVFVDTPAQAGRHVRRAGGDIRAGTRVLTAETRLTPLHLGVLASMGLASVAVQRRPRVAIASTGNEIAAPEGSLGRHQVYDANRFVLGGIAEQAGAEVVTTALLRDNPEAIAAWMTTNANEMDVIITSGGASVGERDWVRHVLAQEGELFFWHVSIKPGKPVAFGRMGRALVFVLPGNPGSTFACANAFVAPALRAMAGHAFDPVRRPGTLSEDAPGDARRTLLCPVRVNDDLEEPPIGGPTRKLGALRSKSARLGRTRGSDPRKLLVHPLPMPSSQLLTPYLEADGMIVLPPGGLPAGSTVLVEPYA